MAERSEKIATYQAKELAIRPSNAGYEAKEMAGRRIGPFAEQAARAITEVANLNAQVEKDLGNQQTAFLRFEGLEAREDRGGIKYGGGLKDMFQLGAGGNEPNYARLNRLADLQNGPLYISDAARHIVRAQSPLNSINPQTAFDRRNLGQTGGQLDTNPKTGGIAPTPDVSDEEAAKSGFNVNGTPSDTYPADLGGAGLPDVIPGGYVNPGLNANSGESWTPSTPWSPYATGVPDNSSQQGDQSGTSSGAVQAIGTLGGLWPLGGQSDQGPSATATIPPPVATSQWPTTPVAPPDQPTTPADNSAAPPFWGDLQGGF
jgi:hypothetical protein